MLEIILASKKRVHALERSRGSPRPRTYMILKQGLLVWYTAMVYNHGIQEVRKQK